MKHLLLFLLLCSCTKDSLTPVGDVWDNTRSQNNLVYYANTHLTNMNFPTTPMNVWSGTVIFKSSCEYYCQDTLNQDDYNKLFGIRKSPLYLHRNGAYIGWCYVPEVELPDGTLYNKIRLAWYLHDDDGSFVLMPLSETVYVDLNTPVYLYIRNHNNNFTFVLNDEVFYINKWAYNIDNFSNGWRLNPWSGGSETQDHNMIISINN